MVNVRNSQAFVSSPQVCRRVVTLLLEVFSTARSSRTPAVVLAQHLRWAVAQSHSASTYHLSHSLRSPFYYRHPSPLGGGGGWWRLTPLISYPLTHTAHFERRRQHSASGTSSRRTTTTCRALTKPRLCTWISSVPLVYSPDVVPMCFNAFHCVPMCFTVFPCVSLCHTVFQCVPVCSVVFWCLPLYSFVLYYVSY
jgi:hypothetical protein